MRRNRAGVVVTALLAVATGTVGPASAQTDQSRIVDVERRIVAFDGADRFQEGSRLTISLDTDVLFEFDEARLTPQARQTLTAVADEMSERSRSETVLIVGHTDARGSDAYNEDLSRRRATAVRDFLADAVDVDMAFEIEGRGEREPVAPNENPDGSDNPAGRRRNGRARSCRRSVYRSGRI